MDMDFFMFFLLCVFRVVFSSYEDNMEYYFIDLKLSWFDAQQYCREHYTDLATISNMEDLGRLDHTGQSWIGLSDDPASWKGVMGNDSNSWRWSATGTTSPGGYQKWEWTEPNNRGAKSHCARIKDGKWRDGICKHPAHFVCFTASSHQGPKTFTPVSAYKSWTAAQRHCRQLYTDLAMIENETENKAVGAFFPRMFAWIGLYREPWSWSDGSQGKFTNWVNGEPNNYRSKEHCASVCSSRTWNDVDCSRKLSFHCEKAPERKHVRVVKMKLLAAVDLSDPDVSIIEQIQGHLLKMGLAHVEVKWKKRPEKSSKPFLNTVGCSNL